MHHNQVLAIDIGGTSLKYAYISENGLIYEKENVLTKNLKYFDEFMEVILPVVQKAIEKDIRQIGISSLGIFDNEGLCMGGVENLSFLQNKNISLEIKAKYPQIDCRIINDGVAAAMGEYWLGEGQDCNNFICVTLGTGIGGAIILDGKPVVGSHFQSGEIGYTDYRSENDYMEVHHSTKGILCQAAYALNLEELDGHSFIDYIREENPICIMLFEKWMETLGKMFANYVLLLDPEKIIIGGGISGQKEFICTALYEKMQLHLPQGFGGKTQVKAAMHGNDAGLLGAAEMFFNK